MIQRFCPRIWVPVGSLHAFFSDPQSIYRILASTNLINWTEVGVVTNIFGETTFTDSSATNLPAQFYKASP